MHRLENIERQEEKGSGSVKTKLERHLVIEFGLKTDIGDNFRAIVINVWRCQQIQRLSFLSTFKGVTDIHGVVIRN